LRATLRRAVSGVRSRVGLLATARRLARRKA